MAEAKKKVRIGFIGVGGMGQMAHLRNYVRVEDCEVVALAELREKTGQLVATRYGIPNVYRTHKEMLAAERLDAVVASQMFDVHAALLPEVYGKVKYVFTEKPLAIGVKAGRKLAAAAAKAGTVHMVGYHKRSDPATMYAKALVEKLKQTRELGALKYVRILMPAGDWVANGFIDLLTAGDPGPTLAREPVIADLEGAEPGKAVWEWTGPAGDYVRFVNYYIHQVNLMRHLFGEPYKVTFADKAGVLMAVESKSGVTGTIEMSPYCTTVAWEESALVAFDKGYVKLSLPAPLTINRAGRVEYYRDPGNGATPERIIPTLPWVGAMRQQAINFVKVCKGEMPPPCDAAEAAEDLAVARQYIKVWKGV
ncbi:MAG: Inositol 2-dehydrogenase/D-chiro-inositol 3-dehydrogenase [Lentisphaerae bacterium ADurb.BinA184]|nr:MAG: Inositol 2-dehydrogenase/D-chiro-inositol 3-dehydrogenase [Lentisphaerae bacterium ADurb.BinA184]